VGDLDVQMQGDVAQATFSAKPKQSKQLNVYSALYKSLSRLLLV